MARNAATNPGWYTRWRKKQSARQAELQTAEASVEDEDTDDGLESMSVAELREYAAIRGIDLAGARRKSDILDAIRSPEPLEDEEDEDEDEEDEEDEDEDDDE